MTSTRLVSLTQRSVAAIEYTVEAVDEFALITVQSELVANEDLTGRLPDPRVSAVLRKPLEPLHHEVTEEVRCCCTGPRSASCRWPRRWTIS